MKLHLRLPLPVNQSSLLTCQFIPLLILQEGPLYQSTDPNLPRSHVRRGPWDQWEALGHARWEQPPGGGTRLPKWACRINKWQGRDVRQPSAGTHCAAVLWPLNPCRPNSSAKFTLSPPIPWHRGSPAAQTASQRSTFRLRDSIPTHACKVQRSSDSTHHPSFHLTHSPAQTSAPTPSPACDTDDVSLLCFPFLVVVYYINLNRIYSLSSAANMREIISINGELFLPPLTRRPYRTEPLSTGNHHLYGRLSSLIAY